LGAEKFINIKCRRMGLKPSAVVLVATIRALKHHGGENGIQAGTQNLRRHIQNITQTFGLPCVVAINRFPTDTEDEIEAVKNAAQEENVPCELSEVHAKGGAGGIDLANAVLKTMEQPNAFTLTYEDKHKLKTKMESVAKKVYRADGINFTPEATRQLRNLEKLGYGHLPVCMAKTQYSFSDNPALLGRPTGFSVTVREVLISAGAGFAVALAGDIMTMPGLPKRPAAVDIDIDDKGNITGLF
jgi:formate--tetrahydrofolate ligase